MEPGLQLDVSDSKTTRAVKMPGLIQIVLTFIEHFLWARLCSANFTWINSFTPNTVGADPTMHWHLAFTTGEYDSILTQTWMVYLQHTWAVWHSHKPVQQVT
jgi:hypothetical protein